MSEPLFRLADLSDPQDRDHFLQMLDHYSRDEFGGGQPLPPDVAAVLPQRWHTFPGAFTILAMVDQTPVGMANCLTSFSTFRAKPRINIHDLVVTSHVRGRGIGRGLIEAVCREASRRGACQVSLEVRADNPRARGLYQRCGFRGIEIPLEDSSHLFGTRSLESD